MFLYKFQIYAELAYTKYPNNNVPPHFFFTPNNFFFQITTTRYFSILFLKLDFFSEKDKCLMFSIVTEGVRARIELFPVFLHRQRFSSLFPQGFPEKSLPDGTHSWSRRRSRGALIPTLLHLQSASERGSVATPHPQPTAPLTENTREHLFLPFGWRDRADGQDVWLSASGLYYALLSGIQPVQVRFGPGAHAQEGLGEDEAGGPTGAHRQRGVHTVGAGR